MRSPVYLAIKKCSETRKSRSIYGAAIQIRTGVHVPRSRLRGSPERPRIEMRFAQGMRSPVYLAIIKKCSETRKFRSIYGAAIQIRTGVHVPRSRLRGSPERPRIEMRFAQGMRSPVYLAIIKKCSETRKFRSIYGAAIQIRTGVHVPRSRLRGSPERPRIRMRFAQGMRSPVLPTVKENLQNPKALKVSGAAIQIRTGDLILTKDALYLLSYSSIS